MAKRPLNLLLDLPQPARGEVLDELLCLGRVRIERIVSSPASPSMLYDQVQHEWVLLLQGQARLWLAGEEIELGAGDSLCIPARTPHRVLWTSADPLCVWLAVHIEAEPTRASARGSDPEQELDQQQQKGEGPHAAPDPVRQALPPLASADLGPQEGIGPEHRI